ncbi:hypothetical protein HOF40_02470 [Candidatus Parcubacteria bacterium]|jgi:hypothetical protein|nr:hypothetical protein [Candidatus Parcubacteria bacterium]MBT3948930.1 hypothetical protein [Candidatus Parcubacteria bacterium]
MKKVIISLYIISLFLPAITQAQVDQRCWIKEDCMRFREGLVDTSQVAEGFYSAADHKDALGACGAATDASGRDLGFCLPAGKAVTAISFGGKTEFSSIADFIQYIYRYGFIIGSVIAVAMIILGGILWIFSGGSADAITKAKKKIGGALMGLVLIALSYSILNLVNPYLVNLRLPEIWAINSQGLVTPTCTNLSNPNVGVAFAYPQGTDLDASEKKEKLNSASYKIKAGKAECGSHYFVDKTGGQTCRGTFCGERKPRDPPEICAPILEGDESNIYECVRGQLVLELGVGSTWQTVISETPLIGIVANKLEGEGSDWLDDDFISFVGVCEKDGVLYEGDFEWWDGGSEYRLIKQKRGTTGKFSQYIIIVDNLAGPKAVYDEDDWCDSDQKLVGFWMYGEIGKDWDPWEDARFWVGQSDNSFDAVVGKWDNVGWKNYLSYENLDKKGIYMRVLFSDNILDGVLSEEDTWPTENSKVSIPTKKPESSDVTGMPMPIYVP